ncbi:MAG: RecQ family ATP-dependent DNA helicase [Solirubrobacterales bacterium]|nr:RecQ family ATP-dependent DNA helicase [Solirubrobacterales bacterium]
MSGPDDRIPALLARFGHTGFRPGQEAAVTAALAGRDVLAVMPTGAGKSLCYQLPALASEGLTLVVSPLVALMDDQISSLQHVAPGEVAAVHGLRDPEENDYALEQAAEGKLRLLYLAPERLANARATSALKACKLERVVVDEAHCVSSWGHDFRPDYFRLGEAARRLGADRISAFTATATDQVTEDIARRLGLSEPEVIRTGFNRPNISLTAMTCQGRPDEDACLKQLLEAPQSRPAIIYAGTRKQTGEVAKMLKKHLGVRVEAYHAGLERKSRGEIQRRFMGGETEIVVATNAFGMGVDKADVRTVVHVAVPGSLEALYQEAGRGGRDGLPSRAVLLAEPRDRSLHVHFIKSATVEDDQLKSLVRLLREAADDRGLAKITARSAAGACGGGSERATAALGHLAFAGVLTPIPSPPGEVSVRLSGELDEAALARSRAAARDAEKLRWRRYNEVWGYVDGETCRRQAVLDHFGDKREAVSEGPCCDVCDKSLVPKGAPAGAAGTRAKGGPRRVVVSAEDVDGLEAALLATVRDATPTVGRTRLVEIMRGSQSKSLLSSGQDGLEHYGEYSHLSKDIVLTVVDDTITAGRLVSTGGSYPKLKLAA